jgi:hypothetical protein
VIENSAFLGCTSLARIDYGGEDFEREDLLIGEGNSAFTDLFWED